MGKNNLILNLVLLGTFKNFSNTLGNAWSNILRKDSRLRRALCHMTGWSLVWDITFAF